LLPQLSSLSVSCGPGSRLRLRCSCRYLRISPLHRQFHSPRPHSSAAVSGAVPELSPGISLPTCRTAYGPFTPSHSEQRWPPTFYRGCWHVVSRGLFCPYSQGRQAGLSSGLKGVYTPKGFIPHAASLRQAFAHCARFPTAASRRSLDRVAVPVWPATLSGQLPVVALVSRYLTN
jgi:hypothetical protein